MFITWKNMSQNNDHQRLFHFQNGTTLNNLCSQLIICDVFLYWYQSIIALDECPSHDNMDSMMNT